MDDRELPIRTQPPSALESHTGEPGHLMGSDSPAGVTPNGIGATEVLGESPALAGSSGRRSDQAQKTETQRFVAFVQRWGLEALEYLVKPCHMRWGIFSLALIVLVFFWRSLIAPGVLFASFMAHDNFIFIDGVHRVWDGCVPHLDFVTGLGFLNFVGPSLASPFTDSEPIAMLYYQMGWVIFATVFSLYLSVTRLHNASAIALLVYTTALVGAPVNVGDSRMLITLAMFYNRYGWALLTFAFLLLLPHRKPSRKLASIDSLMMGITLLLSLYTKITYFAAILGLCILAAVVYRREFVARCVGAITLLAVGMLAVEWHWAGLHAAYWSDIQQLSSASNGAKFNVLSELKHQPREFILAGLALFILRGVYQARGTYSLWRHVILAGYLSGCAAFIILNNAQNVGLPSMIAIMIGALTLLLVNLERIPEMSRNLSKLAMLGLLAYYFVPEVTERLAASERHGRKASRVTYAFEADKGLDRYVISEGNHELLERMNPENQEISQIEMIREIHNSAKRVGPLQEIYQSEYAFMVSKGASALRDVVETYGKGGVINFDFSNPFSTLLDLPSVRGEYAWYHSFRNITEEVHIDATALFADAKYVSIPHYPMVKDTTDLLENIYMDHIEKHYRLVHSDFYWDIWAVVPGP